MTSTKADLIFSAVLTVGFWLGYFGCAFYLRNNVEPPSLWGLFVSLFAVGLAIAGTGCFVLTGFAFEDVRKGLVR